MVVPCSEVAISDAEKESEARCKAMLNKLISMVKEQTVEMEALAVRLKATVQPLGPSVRALPLLMPAPTATLVTAVDHAVAAAAPRAEAALAPKSPTKCSTWGPDTNASDLQVLAESDPETGVPTVAPALAEHSSAPSLKLFSTIRQDTLIPTSTATKRPANQGFRRSRSRSLTESLERDHSLDGPNVITELQKSSNAEVRSKGSVRHAENLVIPEDALASHVPEKTVVYGYVKIAMDERSSNEVAGGYEIPVLLEEYMSDEKCDVAVSTEAESCTTPSPSEVVDISEEYATTCDDDQIHSSAEDDSCPTLPPSEDANIAEEHATTFDDNQIQLSDVLKSIEGTFCGQETESPMSVLDVAFSDDPFDSNLEVADADFDTFINWNIIQPVATSNNKVTKACKTQGDAISGFGKYKLMRVLDLEECSDVNDGHLKDICKLWNLRYLSLGVSITMLPKEIVKLKLLETLLLSKTTVNELPVEVIGLPCLIHLIGKFKLPDQEPVSSEMEQLSKGSNLETLAGYVASDQSRVFPQLTVSYFAEIEDLAPDETRKFNLVIPGMPAFNKPTVDVEENAQGKYRLYEPGYTNVLLPFVFSFGFKKTNDSSKGPILNAMEIYKYVQITMGSQDSNIMASLVSRYLQTGWAQEGGDPCLLPVMFFPVNVIENTLGVGSELHCTQDHDAAACFLAIGMAIILSSWSENYGYPSDNKDLMAQFKVAAKAIASDEEIALLGAIQSLLEGSMYTFVFLWTPALSPNDEEIPHGFIFATFMPSSMLGSISFGACLQLLGFCIFESCVCIFWPSIMKMRSQYIPEKAMKSFLQELLWVVNSCYLGVLVQQKHGGDCVQVRPGMEDLLVPWDPGGNGGDYSFVSAWGQAEIQGGRNVIYQPAFAGLAVGRGPCN